MREFDQKAVEDIRRLHVGRAEAIRRRLEEFSQILPSEYFYELVYCILTPQSSAASAAKAVQKLKGRQFREEPINPEEILFEKDSYIRFHKTKARLLVQMKVQFPEILAAVSNGESGVALREWLVKHVKGLGYKEASHFLRNIGCRDLAILDRHVLKNLEKFGAIRTIPKTLTRKRYLKLEQAFHRFASVVGITMDELDLLFWSLETGEIMK